MDSKFISCHSIITHFIHDIDNFFKFSGNINCWQSLFVDKVESQQLNDGQLVIGFATKQLLDKLVNESDKRKRDQFY